MDKSVKTIIIEDEEPARILVINYLKSHPQIEITGEFSDGFNAVKAINEMKPDLIFLDIQLPKLTGFEILELIEHKPVIVFTTAYDQFAIKAFEMNAVDYLLKPFSADRFNVAVDKAIDKLSKKLNEESKLKSIVKSIETQDTIIDRIVVKTGSKLKVIPIDTINYIEAQDDYVMIYTSEGKHLKEKTMKYYESHLNPKDFIRIHRSYIVNMNQIARLEQFSKDNYIVILKDNTTKLKVSSSGYKSLKKSLSF
jgi:two-component system LytT family response regulator